MAKNFAPRLAKRDRQTLDFSDRLSRDLFKMSDERLFADADLQEVRLKDIVVKEQVRTKFNDQSIKDLGENIRINGLIQPLVLHRTKGALTLVCGERRYRAMRHIEKETAPCFILENKTEQELMAIQFSENSAREELHYVDQADGIYNYQQATGASERQIVKAMGISKSEVHRGLQIAKMDRELKEAAKIHNVEKYVLIEWNAVKDDRQRQDIRQKVIDGVVVKRSDLQKCLRQFKAAKATPPPAVEGAAVH